MTTYAASVVMRLDDDVTTEEQVSELVQFARPALLEQARRYAVKDGREIDEATATIRVHASRFAPILTYPDMVDAPEDRAIFMMHVKAKATA